MDKNLMLLGSCVGFVVLLWLGSPALAANMTSTGGGAGAGVGDVPFDQNYMVTWGEDHVTYLDQATRVQLSMDNTSGAGFASKQNYGSGVFHLRVKVPGRDSAGVVTAYYLTSGSDNLHDEVDFEFLGNREGKSITLQTNIFADGRGNREQRTLLWFDPTTDFHNYSLLWNQHQIVFFVDRIPIRVHKNNKNKGVGYPSKPMRVEASLWNGQDWATAGGREKINWAMAPFVADFRGFDFSACPVAPNSKACDASDYWWNDRKFWILDAFQQGLLNTVRKKFMHYDYCTDKSRFPTPPPECLYN